MHNIKCRPYSSIVKIRSHSHLSVHCIYENPQKNSRKPGEYSVFLCVRQKRLPLNYSQERVIAETFNVRFGALCKAIHNEAYHSPLDRPERLDYQRMAMVVQGVYEAVLALANEK